LKLPLKAEINLNMLTSQVSSSWPLVLPGDGLLALLPNDETKGQDLINLLSLQVLLVWTVKRELG